MSNYSVKGITLCKSVQYVGTLNWVFRFSVERKYPTNMHNVKSRSVTKNTGHDPNSCTVRE